MLTGRPRQPEDDDENTIVATQITPSDPTLVGVPLDRGICGQTYGGEGVVSMRLAEHVTLNVRLRVNRDPADAQP
ncbi:hypothetical protein GCM10009619_40180 [Williamsia maris]